MGASDPMDKLCSNCHWWFDMSGTGTDKMRMCILHTGMRNTKAMKVKFSGSPLKTTADFGCTEWTKDERKKNP